MSYFDTTTLRQCCDTPPVGRVQDCDCGCGKEVYIVKCPVCFTTKKALSMEKVKEFWEKAK